MKDFFISYTAADKDWAEWIAWTLEEAGHSVVIQAWDFRAGQDFVLEMDKAAQQTERTILVLSDEYLSAGFTGPEWAAAFRRDPRGEKRALIPVRVRRTEPGGMLSSRIYLDLVGVSSAEIAREALLDGLAERSKPASAPGFPGNASSAVPLISGRGIAGPVSFPGPIWNVPLRKNPFFTGREETLQRIAQAVKAAKVVALTGLGGIGKTQTAAQYAYLHCDEYNAVLWASAESQDQLDSDFASIAGLLGLREAEAGGRTAGVRALVRWFETNTGWLLILDNANELSLLRRFVPSGVCGDVLITTQAHATGEINQRVEIREMDTREAAVLLLRRAKLIGEKELLGDADPTMARLAEEICYELGGIPLAIDQAGAYLEETNCGLSAYRELYRKRRSELLQRRGRSAVEHHSSVATTVALAFEKVKQSSPASAELLRLCAFLQPDLIPEEVFTEGAPELGPTLQRTAEDAFELNDALARILDYSLLRRDLGEKAVVIHRLVQSLISGDLSGDERRLWAERAVRSVSRAFHSINSAHWNGCERLVPQVLTCARHMEEWGFEFAEATGLLDRFGIYQRQRMLGASRATAHAFIPAVVQSLDEKPIKEFLREYFSARGRVVLFASDRVDAAIEDNVLIGSVEASSFSRRLVEGLETRKADLDDDGRITVGELYDYAYKCMLCESPALLPSSYQFDCEHELVIGYDPGRLKPTSLGLFLSEKRRALVITNSVTGDPIIPSLTAREPTTQAFARVLSDRAICGFAVKILLDESSQVIKEGIRGFFAERDRDEWLLLYYSGYGFTDGLGRLYLVATDTRHELLQSTAIGIEFIKRAMDACRSRRQVLILDCVNIGAFQLGVK